MPTSPLLIQPAFEYVFDDKQTLYRAGANLLYEMPVGRFRPYLGVGST